VWPGVCPGVAKALIPGSTSPSPSIGLTRPAWASAHHPSALARAAFHDRIPVGGAEAHRRVREGRLVAGRHPSVVVEVQVREQHHVDVGRLDARRGQLAREASALELLRSLTLGLPLDDAVAEPGVDQRSCCAGAGSCRSRTGTWKRCATPATATPWHDSRPWTGTGSTPRSSTRRSARSAPSGSCAATGVRSAAPSPTTSATFAAHDPNRLAVAYQVPIIDIPYAVEEVQRLAALGARAVHLPNFPSEVGLPDYHDPPLRPPLGRAPGNRPVDQPAPRQPPQPLRRLPARPDAAGGDLHVDAVVRTGRGDRPR
jgi:hypothetical protein